MKLQTILAIIQQSEYDFFYIEDWLKRNKSSQMIEVEKMTPKIKLVKLLLQILSPLPLLLKIKIALYLIKPIDFLIKHSITSIAKLKLYLLKAFGLKIIAVSGSYGKTSVKHIMKYLLDSQIQVKMTPKSINTPIGIADYILNNLNFKDKLFIAELGEYYRGDITILANFVMPDYGVITPIGRQHLERMGSVEAIADTILELKNYFEDENSVIISDNNLKYSKNHHNFYGNKKNSNYQVTNVRIDRRGTEFKVTSKDLSEETLIFMPLYGEHQANNILPSLWIAQKLNLDLKTIINKCHSLPFITRRHEPQFMENNVLLLDNSYNTNPDSVKASLKLVEQLKPSKTILITMGFTELGSDSEKIHFEFGKSLVKQVNILGLIKTPNLEYIVKGFLEGGGNKKDIIIADTLDLVLEKTASFYIPNSIVLIEGGYREIYT